MEAKNPKSQEKLQKNYLWERKKIFWITLAEMAFKLILTAVVLSPSLALYLLSRKHGALPDMTEKDIAMFTRIDVKYFFPSWWNFVFSSFLVLLLYWMAVSKWFKRETETIMHYLLIVTVAAGGIIFSVLYGGMLYGLAASLTFMIMLVVLILSSPWLSDLLFNDRSRI